MDLAFAEAGAAEELRAAVVLQGPGQDFAGAGGSTIDQGDHRAIVEGACYWRSLFGNAVAILGFNDHIAGQQVVGHGQPGAHQPTGVVAQIQHQPFDAFGL